MAVKNVTDITFTSEIQKGLVLVDFWAPWCGPCKMIAPVLEELDAEMGDKVKIVKMDVDENHQVPGQFGIMSIPTMILFKDGQPLGKMVGYQPKDVLAEVIKEYM